MLTLTFAAQRAPLPSEVMAYQSGFRLMQERINFAEACLVTIDVLSSLVEEATMSIGLMPETLSKPKELGGPIAVVKSLSTFWKKGLLTFVKVVVYISIFVALMNLFPIPGLDGWGLVMTLAEALLGKPLSEDWQRVVARSSLSILLGLSLAILGKDIWDLL